MNIIDALGKMCDSSSEEYYSSMLIKQNICKAMKARMRLKEMMNKKHISFEEYLNIHKAFINVLFEKPKKI